MAMSACFTIVSGEFPALLKNVTPMLTVLEYSLVSSRYGWLSVNSTFSLMMLALVAGSAVYGPKSSRITTNSSPPRRATVSLWRTQPIKRLATCSSSLSPIS